jgi:hypothetical protein
MTPLVPRIREALAAFKGNIYKQKLHRQIVLPYSYNNHAHKKYRGYLRIIFGTRGVVDTAGAKIGDLKVEYLREFEAICNQGPKWDGLMKKPEVENRVTLSL